LIGFSLGAHVPNFAANTLKEHNIFLPRITGLDPAMPLFITSPIEEKLDPSDADFVDVIHTNALIQGKIEKCGHVDFYMNGGIVQPGCWTMGRSEFIHENLQQFLTSFVNYRSFRLLSPACSRLLLRIHS
jgi:pancreatic lipase-related protein 2